MFFQSLRVYPTLAISNAAYLELSSCRFDICVRLNIFTTKISNLLLVLGDQGGGGGGGGHGQ